MKQYFNNEIIQLAATLDYKKNHPSDTPERRSEKLLISHELKLKTKTGKDVDQFNK